MQKRVLLTIGLCLTLETCFSQPSSGWNQDQEEVLEVIFQVFEGMRKADTTGYHRIFMPDARLLTVVDRESGNEYLKADDIGKFFESMAKPRQVVYDEPLWDMQVQIDGRLAQVWTKYAFFAGEKFSHCGVDAFQLFKDKDNRWKIFQLVDTRHFGEGNCDLPDKLYRSLSDF